MTKYEITPYRRSDLFIATDALRRLRLSAALIADIVVKPGDRIALATAAGATDEVLIAIKQDPAGTFRVDKRYCISAAAFFDDTRIKAEAARYLFVGEQDRWLVFKRATPADA